MDEASQEEAEPDQDDVFAAFHVQETAEVPEDTQDAQESAIVPHDKPDEVVTDDIFEGFGARRRATPSLPSENRARRRSKAKKMRRLRKQRKLIPKWPTRAQMKTSREKRGGRHRQAPTKTPTRERRG